MELAQLTGAWRGRARLWFEADVLVFDDTVEGDILGVGGGRWVRHVQFDLGLRPVSPDPFGGAWKRLAAPAMLANASALTALSGLPATPSRSPNRASTSRTEH